MYSQIVIILPKKDSLLTLVINYQQITTFWFEGVLNTVTALSKSLWNFILLISALPLKKVNFIVTYSYRRQREMVCAYFITTISPRIYFIHIGKKKNPSTRHHANYLESSELLDTIRHHSCIPQILSFDVTHFRLL